MNIFYLNRDPIECALQHCDKHVVKMIIEYAQLMSTAHRVLDGELFFDKAKNGRKLRRFRLPDDRDSILMLSVHENHPSNIWLRKADANYKWLWKMWYNLNKEYTYRRNGTQHLSGTVQIYTRTTRAAAPTATTLRWRSRCLVDVQVRGA